MPRFFVRSLCAVSACAVSACAVSAAAAITAAGMAVVSPTFAQKPAPPKKAAGEKVKKNKMQVTHAPWGKLADGTVIDLYTLHNKNGLTADIATYGATLVRLNVPDKNGKMGDVVLGFDTVGEYVAHSPFFGATVGRVGNRIAKGKFALDGKEYSLAINNAPNSLHGGSIGWDKKVWKATPGKAADGSPQVKFTYTSPDGEENFPGTVHASVTYTLTSDNAVRLDYEATTDKPTIINLTNHSYFNLAGSGGGTILNQRAKLYAARYTPVDDTLIPTGEIARVAGTPFDLTTETPFGTHMAQIPGTGGYDHNYVRDHGDTFGLAAEVYDPDSGRLMTVKTDQPGFQLYAGLGLDGKTMGKNGIGYPKFGAFCIETQNFPDAINHANFPSPVLRPGQTYHQHTEYVFGVR